MADPGDKLASFSGAKNQVAGNHRSVSPSGNEAGSAKSRRQQDWFLLEALRGHLS